jgi:hypothetical protein
MSNDEDKIRQYIKDGFGTRLASYYEERWVTTLVEQLLELLHQARMDELYYCIGKVVGEDSLKDTQESIEERIKDKS